MGYYHDAKCYYYDALWRALQWYNSAIKLVQSNASTSDQPCALSKTIFQPIGETSWCAAMQLRIVQWIVLEWQLIFALRATYQVYSPFIEKITPALGMLLQCSGLKCCPIFKIEFFSAMVLTMLQCIAMVHSKSDLSPGSRNLNTNKGEGSSLRKDNYREHINFAWMCNRFV